MLRQGAGEGIGSFRDGTLRRCDEVRAAASRARAGPEPPRTHDGGAGANPDPAVRERQTEGTSAGAVRWMSVTSASTIERRNAAVPSSVTVPSSSKRPGVDWM